MRSQLPQVLATTNLRRSERFTAKGFRRAEEVTSLYILLLGHCLQLPQSNPDVQQGSGHCSQPEYILHGILTCLSSIWLPVAKAAAASGTQEQQQLTSLLLTFFKQSAELQQAGGGRAYYRCLQLPVVAVELVAVSLKLSMLDNKDSTASSSSSSTAAAASSISSTSGTTANSSSTGVASCGSGSGSSGTADPTGSSSAAGVVSRHRLEPAAAAPFVSVLARHVVAASKALLPDQSLDDVRPVFELASHIEVAGVALEGPSALAAAEEAWCTNQISGMYSRLYEIQPHFELLQLLCSFGNDTAACGRLNDALMRAAEAARLADDLAAVQTAAAEPSVSRQCEDPTAAAAAAAAEPAEVPPEVSLAAATGSPAAAAAPAAAAGQCADLTSWYSTFGAMLHQLYRACAITQIADILSQTPDAAFGCTLYSDGGPASNATLPARLLLH
jgi:hypothetical protein